MSGNTLDWNKVAVDLVQKNLDRLITGIYKVSTDQYKQLQIRTRKAFETYLVKAIEKYSKVRTLINRSEPVNLYDFYVDIDLVFNGSVIDTKNIDRLLNINKNLMILGSGGTGKSTLFKHLFLNAIETTSKIPIFVQLRNINENNFSLEDCIYESLSTLGFCLEKEYFIRSLDKVDYIFLLDGFDEVDDDKKPKLITEIINMTTKYSNNYVLVSSRNFDNFSMGWDNFFELKMVPLNKDKAIELIEKIRFEEEVKEKFKKQLSEKLFEQHESFCSNPLLLTLMLMTFDEFSEIPDKIHIFYGQAFDVLYHRHDALKPGFKRPRKTKLASDEFRRVIEAISAFSYLEKVISFDNDKLIEYINKAKKLESLNFEATDYKSDLVEAVCILLLDGLKYTYQHRSFQEYFTARFVSRQTDELQTTLLHRLFKERRSVQDKVLDLIFDMDKYKMEKNIIVPTLRQVRDLSRASTEKKFYLNFLQNYYKLLEMHFFVRKDGRIVVFPHFISLENNLVTRIINFVVEKYMNVDFRNYRFKAIFDSVEDAFNELKIGTICTNKTVDDIKTNLNEKIKHRKPPRYIIVTANYLENEESHDLIMELSSHIKFAVNSALTILDQIEREHEERYSLEELFQVGK
ncbi:NACHT domain-containing protein [Thermaerobacillus caldiproteolyticus]|uniref:NACHT domain-containing protein n=1 Tax=Thermaerobacillus caldiproteolyticus TaxID=247480 RepID=UPI00188C6C3B|nr:NACHT domain-containing protein [Anoxybacillus caldiproteolyticus]QPA32226.1 NACHT domain-containing protein [Anoxybacillus caldiproteolyticus]